MLGRLLLVLAALVAAVTLYFFIALSWSYSEGERAGWVQKFSNKGWFCKTWEGELSLVSMPGAAPEKFFFTVTDEKVAADITRVMGQRVSLHYEEKVGLPTSCFGETRHYVKGVSVSTEIPLAPGVIIQRGPQQPAEPGMVPVPPAVGASAPLAASAP